MSTVQRLAEKLSSLVPDALLVAPGRHGWSVRAITRPGFVMLMDGLPIDLALARSDPHPFGLDEYLDSLWDEAARLVEQAVVLGSARTWAALVLAIAERIAPEAARRAVRTRPEPRDPPPPEEVRRALRAAVGDTRGPVGPFAQGLAAGEPFLLVARPPRIQKIVGRTSGTGEWTRAGLADPTDLAEPWCTPFVRALRAAVPAPEARREQAQVEAAEALAGGGGLAGEGVHAGTTLQRAGAGVIRVERALPRPFLQETSAGSFINWHDRLFVYVQQPATAEVEAPAGLPVFVRSVPARREGFAVHSDIGRHCHVFPTSQRVCTGTVGEEIARGLGPGRDVEVVLEGRLGAAAGVLRTGHRVGNRHNPVPANDYAQLSDPSQRPADLRLMTAAEAAEFVRRNPEFTVELRDR